MAQARSRNPDDDPGAYLGRAMEEIRLKGGFPSQEALADQLGVGRTRITKAETGESPPDLELLKNWLKACKAHPDVAPKLVCDLARHREAAGPAWFRDFPDVERAAHTIKSWHPMIYPGLVQTRRYATELLRTMGNDEETTQRQADYRIERQAILDQKYPPELIVVIDVTAVHRLVADPATMREQTDHVLELSERPNISILVIPGGVNAGCVGGFTIASVTGKPDVLVAEAVRDVTTMKPSTVAEARRIWERIRSDALPRAASRDLIKEAAEWR